jgi:hypothetical protein
MKNVIAIIDDGINEQLYQTGLLEHNIEVTPGFEIITRTGYDPYLPSHGTTCAAIIKQYAPAAVFSSVKILNDEATGVRTQLIQAIRWCVDNGIRLVNLSLGTVDYRDFDEIRKVVNYAYRQGLMIVAACDNRNIFTCPASLSQVIGVKCQPSGSLKKGEYVYHQYPPDGVEITARGRHTLAKYTGKKRITSPSNSFATPFVTAVVHAMLLKSPGITLDGIKEELRKGAANYSGEDYFPFLYQKIDWVEKAVVFKLGRDVNPPCHMRYFFTVEKMININCGSIGEGLDRIKDVIRREMDNLIEPETVVVAVNDGGLAESGGAVEDFLAEMGRCGRNVVYFNDRWRENETRLQMRATGMKIWHPMVSRYFNHGSQDAVEIDVPVIVVHDFTDRWLIDTVGGLLECFRQDGYNVVACTDTCFGVAAGFEYIPLHRQAAEFASRLKGIYGVSDPDAIIFGMNGGEDLRQLEKWLEIDVKILLIENPGSSGGKIAVDAENTEITFNRLAEEPGNHPVPQTGDNKPLENEEFRELYRSLVDLFEPPV